MPELHWALGYPFALALMLGLRLALSRLQEARLALESLGVDTLHRTNVGALTGATSSAADVDSGALVEVGLGLALDLVGDGSGVAFAASRNRNR